MSQFIPFESLNWAARLMLAQGVIIIFLLLSIVSFSMPHAGDFKPFFLLMAVYYWAIYRPTMMPVAYTFILGLVMDLLSGFPVGLNALMLLIYQMLVKRSRVFLMGQPYVMVWVGFSVMALTNGFALWAFMSLAHFMLLPLSALFQIMVAALLSILLFPLATLILRYIHRILPVASKPFPSVG